MTMRITLWARLRNLWVRALEAVGLRTPLHAYIQSIRYSDVVLEGALIKRLVVPASGLAIIQGPIKEARYFAGMMHITNWDAFEVAKDLVYQWAMGQGDNQTMIYRVPVLKRKAFEQKIVDVCGLSVHRCGPELLELGKK